MKSKVTERLLYLSLNLGGLRGFSILICMWGRPKGFSILIWMGGNREASLSRFELGEIERLLYLNMKLEVTKRFLYLDLNGRQLRGFSISILNCGNQGASLPWSKWKVTKRLLYLGILGDWKASLFQSWIVAPKGFSTLI